MVVPWASGSRDKTTRYGMWAQADLFVHSPGIRLGSIASRLVQMVRPWQAGVVTARFCYGICHRISHLQIPNPDFDGDGIVGFPDFLQFVAQFGLSQGDAGYDAKYDLDGDGTIGFSDFLIFASDFGKEG